MSDGFFWGFLFLEVFLFLFLLLDFLLDLELDLDLLCFFFGDGLSSSEDDFLAPSCMQDGIECRWWSIGCFS